MLFPSSVLCNEAGQGVLRQKVRNAVNSLNREWNFCSYSAEGTKECRDLNIDVKCDHRSRNARLLEGNGEVYSIQAEVPVERYVLILVYTLVPIFYLFINSFRIY